MKFGTEKLDLQIDDSGSTITSIKKYHRGNVEKAFRHYKIRVHVKNAEEEMVEFMRFTDEVATCRANGTLGIDKDDPSTKPAFVIDYPSKDIDGSYFIIKCYAVIDLA